MLLVINIDVPVALSGTKEAEKAPARAPGACAFSLRRLESFVDRSRRRRRFCHRRRRARRLSSERLPYLLPLLLDEEHVDRQVLEVARQRACRG